MATVNVVSTLNGLFKEIYASNINSLIPDSALLTKMVKFSVGERVGNNFHQPVVLSHEHGATFAASGSGAFSINTPIAMTLQDAQINGSQILLASRMDYESAMKSSASKSAFVRGTELLIKTMVESHTKKLEVQLLYGQSGIGKFSATSGSGTTRVYTVLAATFGPQIWAGGEGMALDLYNGASKLNTNAAVVVTAVDLDLGKVSVSGNATDLTAIDTAIGSTPSAFYLGAYGNECAGLDAIITNTGTLFNISAATYNLWKGCTYAVGGTALTMAKVLSAVGVTVARGLNEDAVLLVHPQTWNNLNSDQAALRKYDAKYMPAGATNGFEAIEYFSQAGKISVISHGLVKAGEAFLVPMKRAKRIGACDVTFGIPGSGETENAFIPLQTNAGFEIRSYSHEAMFLETPARACKLTGIVNA